MPGGGTQERKKVGELGGVVYSGDNFNCELDVGGKQANKKRRNDFIAVSSPSVIKKGGQARGKKEETGCRK